MSAMTGLCGIFCLAIWVPAKSYGVLILFALASGTVTGIFWNTVMPVTAEVVGMQRLPSAFGMVCFPLVVPTAFAEPIALRLVSTSGYLSSKVFVGCMFLGGALSTWTLRSWKICDIEKRDGLREEVDADQMGPGRIGSSFWLTPRRLFMGKIV